MGKEDFTEKVTPEANKEGEGIMGNFRQRGQCDKVWRDTLYSVFFFFFVQCTLKLQIFQ